MEIIDIYTEAYSAPKKSLYIATGILDSLFYNYIPSSSDLIDLTHLIKLKPDAIILNYGVSMRRFKYAKKIIDTLKEKYY